MGDSCSPRTSRKQGDSPAPWACCCPRRSSSDEPDHNIGSKCSAGQTLCNHAGGGHQRSLLKGGPCEQSLEGATGKRRRALAS